MIEIERKKERKKIIEIYFTTDILIYDSMNTSVSKKRKCSSTKGSIIYTLYNIYYTYINEYIFNEEKRNKSGEKKVLYTIHVNNMKFRIMMMVMMLIIIIMIINPMFTAITIQKCYTAYTPYYMMMMMMISISIYKNFLFDTRSHTHAHIKCVDDLLRYTFGIIIMRRLARNMLHMLTLFRGPYTTTTITIHDAQHTHIPYIPYVFVFVHSIHCGRRGIQFDLRKCVYTKSSQ